MSTPITYELGWFPPEAGEGMAATGQHQQELNALKERLDRECQGQRCAVCQSRVWVAWNGETWAVRCLKCWPGTPVLERERNIRTLYDPETKERREFDVTTQREIVPLPTTEGAMIERFKQAEGIGLWPQKMNGQQFAILAQVALAYGLDPFMGEIMPYQGRPYITMNGRRRKDEEAGHFASVRFRALTAEEKEMYSEGDALKDGDLAVICVLTTERGQTIEGFGRVLASERKGNAYLPLVSRPIEMAQKRAERRAREMAYGPIALPYGLNVRVAQEGDIIEGEAREIEPGEVERVLDYETGEITHPQETPASDLYPPDEAPDASAPEQIPQNQQELQGWLGQHKKNAAWINQVLGVDAPLKNAIDHHGVTEVYQRLKVALEADG